MESIDLNMEDIFDEQDAGINDLDDDFPTASRVLPDLPPEDALAEGDDQDAENSEVLARLRDMSKGAAKTRVYRPQPKLDAVRLTGERGLPLLPKLFNGIKFKGKGHEADDLRTVMNKYEHWAHRLFPKMTFDDLIERTERLGKKAAVQVHIKRLRMDMPLNPDEGLEGEGEDEGETTPAADRSRIDIDDDLDAEEAFDAIMRDDHEADNTDLSNKNSAQSQPSQTVASQSSSSQSMTTHSSSSQKNTQKASTGLTEEQLERIEHNKRLAQERRAARLGRTTSTTAGTGETMSNNQASLAEVHPSLPDKNNQSSKPAATDTEPNESAQPDSLNKLFPKRVGTWECASCLEQNKLDRKSCVACSTVKSINGNDKGHEEISSTDLKSKSSTAGLSELFCKPLGSWNCDACLVQNKPECSNCVACGAANSSSHDDASKAVTTPIDKTIAASNTSAPSLSALFSKPVGCWNCDVCMVQNKPGLSQCAACGASNSSSDTDTSKTNTLTKSTSASDNTTPSLSALFSKPVGSWNCDVCMVQNKSECSKCVACGTNNTSAITSTNTSTVAKVTTGSDNMAQSLSSVFAKPAGSWNCDVCMVENKPESSDCVACGTSNASDGATKTPVASSLMAKFSKPSGSWDCDGCLLQNIASASKCVACDALKPGAVTAGRLVISEGALSSGKGFQINQASGDSADSTTGGFRFGSSTAQPSTTGGFKFGSSSESTGGFSFGSSSDAAAKTGSTTGGFIFGSSSTGSKTAGLTFGSSTDTASTGSPTTGFRFGSATDAPTVASTGISEPSSLSPSSMVKVGQQSVNMELEPDNSDINNQNNNNYIHQDLPPNDETLPSLNDTLVAVNGTLAPADETVPPADETVPPVDETLPPADETVPPADETVPPADETLPPEDETVTPEDETLPPANETVPLVDEPVPPVNGTLALVDETLLPVDETLPPVDETMPSVEETLPPLQFYEDSEEQTSTQPNDEDMEIAD